MDIILKQRLVGAIVLISLGVIFIPMLLSGKGELSSAKLESNIPPEPQYEIRQPLVLVPEPAMPKTTAPEPRQVVTVTVPEAGQKAAAKPAAEAAKRSATSAAAKQAQATSPSDKQTSSASSAALTTTHTKSTTASKTGSTAATPSKPVAKKPPPRPAPAVSGWVVQVGSFEQRSNANHLRDKLRNKGYASFVEPRKDKRDSVYRVRIGPKLKRSEAEELQKKLLKREKLKGIVMQYPARD